MQGSDASAEQSGWIAGTAEEAEPVETFQIDPGEIGPQYETVSVAHTMYEGTVANENEIADEEAANIVEQEVGLGNVDSFAPDQGSEQVQQPDIFHLTEQLQPTQTDQGKGGTEAEIREGDRCDPQSEDNAVVPRGPMATSAGPRLGPPIAVHGYQTSLWHVIRRCGWDVGLATLLSVFGGFYYLQMAPATYTSRSLLYVEPLDQSTGDTSWVYQSAVANGLSSQARLLRTTPLLARVLVNAGTESLISFANVANPIGRLRDRLDVCINHEYDIISISFTGPDPVEAAYIVNCVIDTYVVHHEQRRRPATLTALRTLLQETGQEYEQLRADLRSSREILWGSDDTSGTRVDALSESLQATVADLPLAVEDTIMARRLQAAEVALLKSQITLVQRTQQLLESRVQTLVATEQLGVWDVTILDPAEPSEASIGPDRQGVLGLALAIGLLAGACWVLVFSWLGRSRIMDAQ